MEFEFCEIDPKTASKEEIKAEIVRLKNLSNGWKNEEQAIKLTINSFYGAIGNKWFIAFNPDVAEAVTLQGQDLIKFAEIRIDYYFQNFWHKDTELHEKLGITKDVRKINTGLVVYCDTDSNYVTLEPVLKSCGFEGDAKQFIINLNEFRLKDYLNKSFEIYAKKWNTDNYQDFELEMIAASGIWLKKKKYVLDPVWQDGIHIESLSKIKATGVEIAQSSTPAFVREKLNELLRYLFEKKKDLVLRDLIVLLRDIKEEFKLKDIEDLSIGKSANNIEKFILNDTKSGFEIAKGTPMHVRAAGYYNFLLNCSAYKDKYELMKSGEKVKYYYVDVAKEGDNNVFAFKSGTYPYEFAPSLDYDLQFSKCLIDPVNRFVQAMGYPAIPPNLFIQTALF